MGGKTAFEGRLGKIVSRGASLYVRTGKMRKSRQVKEKRDYEIGIMSCGEYHPNVATEFGRELAAANGRLHSEYGYTCCY